MFRVSSNKEEAIIFAVNGSRVLHINKEGVVVDSSEAKIIQARLGGQVSVAPFVKQVKEVEPEVVEVKADKKNKGKVEDKVDELEVLTDK